MSLYRVTTQMFDTKTRILLHSSDTIIDAISPAQTMRKHNLPRINSDQIITINITKCSIFKDSLNTGPPHEIDYPKNQPSETELLESSNKILNNITNSKQNKKNRI